MGKESTWSWSWSLSAVRPGRQRKTRARRQYLSRLRYWFVWFLCWHEPTTTRVIVFLGSNENAVAIATRYGARLATDIRALVGVFNSQVATCCPIMIDILKSFQLYLHTHTFIYIYISFFNAYVSMFIYIYIHLFIYDSEHIWIVSIVTRKLFCMFREKKGGNDWLFVSFSSCFLSSIPAFFLALSIFPSLRLGFVLRFLAG